MLPDYGMKLIEQGYTPGTKICFTDFSFFNISVVGIDKFTTMVEYPNQGIVHAMSLDFGLDILNAILANADPAMRQYITAEIMKDPITNRTFDLVSPICCLVKAHLGYIQTGVKENFVPLVIDRIQMPQEDL